MTHQTTTYRIEFGPAWPIPPITLQYSDPNDFHRAVAAHAIPYLRPILAEKGHPEYADCFFHHDRALTVGQFMYVDLVGGKGARFCPARLTAVTGAEESHVVADDSDDPEHVDDCPGCTPAVAVGGEDTRNNQ